VAEHDIDITKILSSDDEIEVEAALRLTGASSDPPEPSVSSEPFDHLDPNADKELEASAQAILTLFTTVWYNPDIVTKAIDGLVKINRQTKIEHVEYFNNDIPSYFPVPRTRTAVILDMRDPKFDFYDKAGDLLPADTLILDAAHYSFRLIHHITYFSVSESRILGDHRWRWGSAPHLPPIQQSTHKMPTFTPRLQWMLSLQRARQVSDERNPV
jgi:hypothetical protein